MSAQAVALRAHKGLDVFIVHGKSIQKFPNSSTSKASIMFSTASFRRRRNSRQPIRSRRLAVESLESRQLLSATPLKFYVVDDATANVSFRYGETGTSQGSSALVAADSAPRGVA